MYIICGVIMTQILEEAWNSVVNLPADRQDSIACIILEELQDELVWESKFEKSQSELSVLADKVRADIKAGKFQQKGFGDL